MMTNQGVSRAKENQQKVQKHPRESNSRKPFLPPDLKVRERMLTRTQAELQGSP